MAYAWEVGQETGSSGRKEGLAEKVESFGIGDVLAYKGETGNQGGSVNLVRTSHGFQVSNEFYSVVCLVAPIEFAVGLDATGWSGA